MDKNEFKTCRQKLKKTQKEMAQLLGVSTKAIHSYEQGWRTVPPSVERQVFFLISRTQKKPKRNGNCWKVKKCPEVMKENCPAWEFDAGNLCWFINGTICGGAPHKTWEQKMVKCRTCKVFKELVVL